MEQTDSVRSAMTKMTQFRNIVVHDYARIDPEIVIGLLNRDMDDLKRFAGEVIGQVAST